MDLLELENKYLELKDFLNEPSSNRTRLFRITDFFNSVLSLANNNLTEVYIADLFLKYLSLIRLIKIRGLDPRILSQIMQQFEKIKSFDFTDNYSVEIESAFKHLQKKYNLLSSWLGGDTQNIGRQIIYFPVLEKITNKKEVGFLEIIKVEITDGENDFSIEPSVSEDDSQLHEQMHLCWENAINYCKNIVKMIKPSHCVQLKFENKLALYIGNSMGIAVTLAFIEAILKHYNSKMIVNINGCVAVTGGIDESSKIISTGKAIIEAKVETVFYSDAEIFCIPKTDELCAEQKLMKLKKDFPNRKLELVGLKDLDDLLSRRNVVDIRKQKLVVRAAKFVKKNWISAAATVLLAILFAFLFVMDFDNNPAMFQQNGNLLNVKNKNGKVLWTTRMNFSIDNSSQDRSLICKKLVDINNDGVNEVILAEEDISPNKNNYGRVACFNNEKKLIWEYNFRDTVSTFRKWSNTYCISLIDTATISGKKSLILMARNMPNFANAVFTVDILSGQRIDSAQTLWNAGALTNALTGDFNEDGTKEIVLAGMQNGFQSAILFWVDINEIKGQTPSPKIYVFNNIPKAKLNKFIILPHTDYGKFYWRSNIVPLAGLNYRAEAKEFLVATREGLSLPITIYYGFDNKLNFLWVDCGDDAQMYRDSLVAHKVLVPPYTNTMEYFNILKNNIRYWDREKFFQ